MPVRVEAADGLRVVVVDEHRPPSLDGLFVSLGVYRFDTAATIVISAAGTKGYVVVDAVQFLPSK